MSNQTSKLILWLSIWITVLFIQFNFVYSLPPSVFYEQELTKEKRRDSKQIRGMSKEWRYVEIDNNEKTVSEALAFLFRASLICFFFAGSYFFIKRALD